MQHRLASLFAFGITAALCAPSPPAAALTFDYVFEFDVGAFGDPGGTPRGLAVFGANLLVNDALDDQIHEANPNGGALVGSSDTDPFTCGVLPPDCIATQEWARVGWDVAWDGTNIWLVDRDAGPTTWLVQLDAAGQFLDRFDITSEVQNPGALEVDPRNGDLLISDRFPDFVYRYDLSGGSPVFTNDIYSVTGSTNPSGLAAFGTTGTFFVADPANDQVLEYTLPTGSGSSTLLGTTTLTGSFTVPAEIESLEYDPVTGRLYILDNQLDRVLVFVPEPGTVALLGGGLLAVAGARRRRAARGGAGSL